MKTKAFSLVVAIGIGAAALFIVLHYRHPVPPSDISRTSGRVFMKSEMQDESSPSEREQRLAAMKAKLAAVAAVPDAPPTENNTGWEGVPRGLDLLITEGLADPEGSVLTLKAAQEYIQKQKLEGTTVTDATCSKSLCRISFVHKDAETCKDYQRRLIFSPWANDVNYFSNEIEKDGTVKSQLWEGRDGFELPIEELRKDNATGKYSEQ